MRFGAQIKWHQFIRVLMYTCELPNEILLVRPLSESGVTPLGKVCKMHQDSEIKNDTKLDFANCILARSSKVFYLSVLHL